MAFWSFQNVFEKILASFSVRILSIVFIVNNWDFLKNWEIAIIQSTKDTWCWQDINSLYSLNKPTLFKQIATQTGFSFNVFVIVERLKLNNKAYNILCGLKIGKISNLKSTGGATAPPDPLCRGAWKFKSFCLHALDLNWFQSRIYPFYLAEKISI